MSEARRRRVIISSDEEDDVFTAREHRKSDKVEDSVVDESDEVVGSSDEGHQSDNEVYPSTPLQKDRNFVSSTPLTKTIHDEDSLNETFDRMSVGEPTNNTSRSLSNTSVHETDRERSFDSPAVEHSPISARLANQSDNKSKQALRERLLRKKVMAGRSSNSSHSSSGRHSLVNTTLSPISIKPIPVHKDSIETLPECDNEEDMKSEKSNVSIESIGSTQSPPLSKNGSMRSNSSEDKPKVSPSNRAARKKLNMDDIFSADSGTSAKSSPMIKQENNDKFMTPRRVKKEDSCDEIDEKENIKTTIIESSDDEELNTQPLNILDSDENEEKEEIQILDSDDEIDQMSVPNIKKEPQMITLSSSPSPPTLSPQRMSTLSPQSKTSNGNHPSTVHTKTDYDIATMERDLNRLLGLVSKANTMKLPDSGLNLHRKIEELTDKIEEARKCAPARRVEPKVKGTLQVIEAPPNPEQYNRMVVDDGLGRKKLVGGQMTEERLENVKKVTGDTIKTMHSEMMSQPNGEETETPKGLRVELMGHQKSGLTWMIWRERQLTPGGILADDMGLGKTISLISLILHSKNQRIANEEEAENIEKEEKYKRKCAKKNLVASHTTLVIAPASVIYQWEAEIEKRVKGNRLTVHVFHGPKGKREDRAKKLAKYDIVITTFNIITAELTEKVNMTNDSDSDDDDDDDTFKGKKKGEKEKTKVSKKQISVLTKVHWERIILDEAHQIKNRNSLISKAVCRLPGANRWCLTGTPVHNNLYDLFSLVRFLRIAPFDEIELWKEYIMNAKNGNDRLNTLVKSLLLRRMKTQVDAKTNLPLVSLKPKMYDIVEVSLEGLEKNIYQMMFAAVQEKVKGFMDRQQEEKDLELFGRIRRKNKAKTNEEPGEIIKNPFIDGKREIDTNDKFTAMRCFLVYLLRLRQAVVHLSLTKEALDLSSFEGLEMSSTDEVLDAELSQLSLDENVVSDDNKKLATSQDVDDHFEREFISSKIKVLLEKLDHATSSGDKCVVVSQWTTVLGIVEYHIIQRGIHYTQITGEIATGDRQERVDSFNRTDGGAQVMLLSLTAGGVGLNLVGGNHLFLIDLHWNPALESQACDRIYRMGQTKNVYIHKLLSKNTIEETILLLQNKKSALAKSVLEGAANKDGQKLSMADLRFLFDLDGEAKKKADREAAEARAVRNANPPSPLPVYQSSTTYPSMNGRRIEPPHPSNRSTSTHNQPEVITL